MSRRKGKVDFEKRKFNILKSIVKEYLGNGAPVSSRVIARKYGLNLSPATIRNIMMDLEEEGYLYQPHTSAGRIPTISGLKFYVSDFLERYDKNSSEFKVLENEMRKKVGSPPYLLSSTTHFLSEITHYTAIALTDILEDLSLKSVALVPEGKDYILAVLVFSGGVVKSVLVDNNEKVEASVLVKIGNYLTETFSGKSLKEIEKEVKSLIIRTRQELNRLAFEFYLKIAEEYFKDKKNYPEILINGELHIMEYPEFSSSEKVKKLLQYLREKEFIIKIIERVRGSGAVALFTGEELGIDIDVAFVTGGLVGYRRGVIGIVGPLRMDYIHVIPAIRFVVEQLRAD